MMFFDMYRLKINGEVVLLEDFKYSISEFEGKKRFRIRVPFGFNKTDEYSDAYPILHNLLITKEYFDMDMEISSNEGFVHFAKFSKCIMLKKVFAPNDSISYEFSGSFKSIDEDNEKFLELTREISFD